MAAVAVQAAPIPSCRYYGQIVNADGSPVLDGAEAVLLMTDGTSEINRCAVMEQLPVGCNYSIEAPLDSSLQGYSDYTVEAGQALTFRLLMNNEDLELTSVSAPLLPPSPGTYRRVDFFVGADADYDGLPDDFEQQIMDASGGTSLAAILPDADADGDGFSNQQELQAGTDPTEATDFLSIDAAQRSGAWIAYSFDAVAGKAYRFYGTDGQLDADGNMVWVPAAYALSPNGHLMDASYVGKEGACTLYLPLTEACQLFKLTVK